jgi:hypothetical protein
MSPLNFMKTSLDHLPEKKQHELARIEEILFEEFELAKGNGQKEYDNKGRILKTETKDEPVSPLGNTLKHPKLFDDGHL